MDALEFPAYISANPNPLANTIIPLYDGASTIN